MLVIGMISGTSVDALDAALIEIDRSGDTLELAIRGFVMLPFDEALRTRVRALMPPHAGSTVAVCEVNVLVGEAFANAALRVAEQAGVPIEQVDLITSHGQTIYHQVAPGTVRSTLQIGSAAVLAEKTGRTIVNDLRPRDMAVGGEGAPLAPYIDVLLFRDDQIARALQNIGGIGNVTYLPIDGEPLAFDTGPGNVLIDEAVRVLTDGAEIFDRDGRMAAAGTVDHELLATWLEHPYFALPAPKSTGRELFGPSEARAYVEQARARDLSPEDTIATLTALTARSIADVYRQLGRVDEALISGGGARNPTLLAMIQQFAPGTRVHTLDEFDLDADAKEAVAFAMMGYATIHGWPGNIPAATGATSSVVLGSMTPGENYRDLLRRIVESDATPPRYARLVSLVSGS